jgi:hypothetical protein
MSGEPFIEIGCGFAGAARDRHDDDFASKRIDLDASDFDPGGSHSPQSAG